MKHVDRRRSPDFHEGLKDPSKYPMLVDLTDHSAAHARVDQEEALVVVAEVLFYLKQMNNS
jgi:hypothetical protein